MHGYIVDSYDFSNEITDLSNMVRYPTLTASIESLYDFQEPTINQKTFAINYIVDNSNDSFDITLNSNVVLQSFMNQTENSNFEIVLDEYMTYEYTISMNDI